MSTKKQDGDEVLNAWVERDLTASFQRGEIPPAFGAGAVLDQIRDIIDAGRNPVVVGEEGVGKSAIISQLIADAQRGAGPRRLAGKRVLQLSFRSRVSTLPNAEKLRPATQKLVAALLERSDEVVPYFRDLHLAYAFDLEPQLEVLALRFPGVILGEGEGALFDAMLETTPALGHHYVKVPVGEPDLGRMESLLGDWAAWKERQGGGAIAPDALLTALHLTHRFLGRSRQPRKTLDLLEQVLSVMPAGQPLTSADVIARFVRSYRVPAFLADPAIPFDPVATEKRFASRLLEQPEAVDAVVRMIALIKSGMSDTRRPFAAFLFVGPTGVGKTHVAQLLAEYLFGSRERLVRINMADHQSADSALALFGNPESYQPSQRRGLLTTRLAGHPFAVLLLDEFEKTSRTVHDRFLQLLDEGTFINAAGETISCRSLIIIATSNAGADVYRARGMGFLERKDVQQLDRELDKIVAEAFRHEFLNRFDQIVHFHPLSRRGIRAIALREIEQLSERIGMRSRGLRLRADESVLDWLTSHGYHPHFGARFLRRTIEREVTTAIADVIVQETLAPDTLIDLSVKRGRIHARAEVAEAQVEEQRQSVSLPEGLAARVRELDRDGILREAHALLDRSRGPLSRLDAQRARASELLARMGEEGFWKHRAEAQQVLAEYRKLDVAAHMGSRLLAPVRQLEALVGADRRVATVELARALERAASSLTEWLDRVDDEGPAAVWLLMRNVDPMQPAADWIEQLVTIERAWCRRLHLSSEVVGFGLNDGSLALALLEVEGPGAGAYLAMERGVHRIRRGSSPDLRVRIDVVARSEPPDEDPGQVHGVRRAPALLGLQPTWSGGVGDAVTGVELRLFGGDRRTVSAALRDIAREGLVSLPDLEVAREYGRDGIGARDPRTAGSVVRFKDVLRGKLDPLLEAWRRARPAS